MKKCPRCNEPMDPSAAFCINCGYSVKKKCSSCGAALPAKAKFCSECGATMEVEAANPSLTQITLLSVDIQGSTALISNIDAEKAHELFEGAIKVMSEIIIRYHGNILALTGDGLAGYFKGPHNPLQTCYAAAIMQKALIEMQLPFHVRVGIHTAEINLKQSSEIMASKHFKITQLIESNASEDSVQISYKVYDQYQDQIEIGNRVNIKIPDQVLPLATYELRGIAPSAEKLIQKPSYEETSDSEEEIIKHEIEGERKFITSSFIKLEPRGEGATEEEGQKIDLIVKNYISRFGGTFVKKAGNAYISFYGAPVAYEDHPLRACLSAYFLYQELLERRLSWKFTIGINTGEAVVGILGSAKYQQYDAIGASVNLAARMMQTAAEDQIQISGDTLKLVDRYIQALPLGTKNVKGFSTPIETFSLVGIDRDAIRKRSNAKFYKGLPFVGRRDEIALFSSYLDKLKKDAGAILAFKADPGIGKTRLVFECSKIAMNHGVRVYSISSSAYEKNESISTLRLIIKTLFGIYTPQLSSLDESNIMLKLPEIKFAEEYAHEAIFTILNMDVSNDKWNELAQILQLKILFQTVWDLIMSLSKNNPIIIIIEDLHWCDEESLKFLTFASSLVDKFPILFLFDYRPEFHLESQLQKFTNERQLSPLTEGDSRQLLIELLPGGEELEPVREKILNWSKGNPYFIEEHVKNLIERRNIIKQDSKYVLREDIQNIYIPHTIESLIESRVDQLSTKDKTVLQQASVLGRVFHYSFLRYINEYSDEELKIALSTLIESDFIKESSLVPEPQYTFKHGFLKEIVYSAMLGKLRHSYHRKLVSEIETDKTESIKDHYSTLAHHAFAGEMWTQALKYYNLQLPRGFTIEFPALHFIKVGEIAEECYSNMNDEERATFFEDYGRVILLYNHSLFITHNVEEAIEQIDILYEKAKRFRSSFIQFYALLTKLVTLAMSGHASYAKENVSHVTTLFKESLHDRKNEELLDLRLIYNVFTFHFFFVLGDYNEFDKLAEEAFKIPFSIRYINNYLGIAAIAILHSNYFWCMINRAKFDTLKDKLPPLEEALKKGLVPSEEALNILVSLGYYHFGCGNFLEAKRVLKNNHEFAVLIEHDLMKLLPGNLYALTLYYCGEKDLALEIAREIFIMQKQGHYFFASAGVFNLAETLALCGDYNEALEVLDAIIPVGESDHEKPLLAACYRVKAMTYNLMAKDEERDEEILNLLAKSKAITEEIGCNLQNPFIHINYEQFYQRVGNEEEAQRHHKLALDYFKNYGMKGWYDNFS